MRCFCDLRTILTILDRTLVVTWSQAWCDWRLRYPSWSIFTAFLYCALAMVHNQWASFFLTAKTESVLHTQFPQKSLLYSPINIGSQQLYVCCLYIIWHMCINNYYKLYNSQPQTQAEISVLSDCWFPNLFFCPKMWKQICTHLYQSRPFHYTGILSVLITLVKHWSNICINQCQKPPTLQATFMHYEYSGILLYFEW